MSTRQTTCLFIVLVLLIALTGCLQFAGDEETTTPTTAQVSRCISEMYLNPSMTITPLGYKLETGGMDDAIWFKFTTDSTDVSAIFDTTVVDVTKFKENFTFLHQMKRLKWWDVKGKNLLGEQVSLPNAKVMNIGIEKTYNGYVVYIMWHEI